MLGRALLVMAAGVAAVVPAGAGGAKERVVAPDLVDYTDDRLDRSFDVAYNRDLDEYLAVWRDFEGFDARGVTGVVVRSDGSVRQGPFEVASLGPGPTELLADSLFSPRVVYDTVNDRYAVVFLRNAQDAATPVADRRSAVVVGQLVSSDGVLVGSEVLLNPPLGDPNADFCVPLFPDIAAEPSSGDIVLVYSRSYASAVDEGDVCEGLVPGGSVTVVQELDGALSQGARVDFPLTNSAGPSVARVSHQPDIARTIVTQPYAGVAETGAANRNGRRFAAQVYDTSLSTFGSLRVVDVDPVEPAGTGPVLEAIPVADSSGGWFVVSAASFFGPVWTNRLDSTGSSLRRGTRLDLGRPQSVGAAGDGTFVIATEAGDLLHIGADGVLVHPAPVLPSSILRNVAVAVGPAASGHVFALGLAVGIGPDGVAGAPFTVVPPGLSPLAPARLLDTRSGPGARTVDRRFEGIGRVNSGGTVALEVAGRGGVPTDAEAVVLNVAATEAAGDGFVTSYPCDASSRPVTANLNYAALLPASAGALTPLSADGRVCLYSSRSAHLVADVNGYVPSGGSVEPLVPARLLESRTGPDADTVDGQFEGIGRIASGSTVPFQVAGRAGVADDAEAVVVNVAAIRPSVETFLTVFPCDEVRPLAANLNAARNTVVNNLVVARLADDGRLCVFASAATDLVVDVAAAVPPDGGLRSLVPARVADTRRGPDDATVDGVLEGIGRVEAGSVVKVRVAGRGGVAAGATGAMLNVAAIRPDTGAFFTVYPCDVAERPLAANLNVAAGEIVSNAVFAALSAEGDVCVFTTATTDLAVDVAGYVVDA